VPRSAPLTDTQLIATRNEDDKNDLSVIDTTTGMVVGKLTDGSPGSQYPTMSPDRSTIVYAQTSDHGIELRMMAADGSGDRSLLAADSEFCPNPQRPAWNPMDTSEIAVACRRGEDPDTLALISVDGTLRSTINTGFPSFDDPTYSPDGKTLAYWASQTPGSTSGAIYTQPVNGSEAPKQITSPGARANDVDPVWSVDGKTIYFRRATEDASGQSSAQILRVQADGSGLTPITDGTAFDNDPSVSPDGTQLAFFSNRTNAAGNNAGQIWVINVDGTGLRQIGIGKPGTASGPPEWSRR
jgi:Tol biopolymer transport system component